MKSYAPFVGIPAFFAIMMGITHLMNRPVATYTYTGSTDVGNVQVVQKAGGALDVTVERSGRIRFSGTRHQDGDWTAVSYCKPSLTTGCVNPPSESRLDRMGQRAEAEAALELGLRQTLINQPS